MGHFAGVYFKQEVKCVKTRCLVRIAEKQKECLFVHVAYLTESTKVGVKKFSLAELKSLVT